VSIHTQRGKERRRKYSSNDGLEVNIAAERALDAQERSTRLRSTGEARAAQIPSGPERGKGLLEGSLLEHALGVVVVVLVGAGTKQPALTIVFKASETELHAVLHYCSPNRVDCHGQCYAEGAANLIELVRT
jgi:hypothetical protein